MKNVIIDYTSEVSTGYLSHFTSKFEILIKIIETGFKPSVPRTPELNMFAKDTNQKEVLKKWSLNLNQKKESDNDYNDIFKIPMVCFCDLPHNIASAHIEKYGEYIIAMNKRWAISKSITPILYVPEESEMHNIFNIMHSLQSRLKDETNTNIINLNNTVNNFSCYTKIFNNETKDYKYYDEREWRYIPEDYFIQKEYKETEYKYCHLKFTKDDFLFAVVKTKSEKEKLLKVLRKEFGEINDDQVKLKL